MRDFVKILVDKINKKEARGEHVFINKHIITVAKKSNCAYLNVYNPETEEMLKCSIHKDEYDLLKTELDTYKERAASSIINMSHPIFK